MSNQNPEQHARDKIDRLLQAGGWHVCNFGEQNITRPCAIREFPLKSGHGHADYLLYLQGKAVGVVEAKKVGYTLKGVEVQSAGYSLDDHLYLVEETPTRLLFDAFRKTALALDPCVTEEILKLYIAYKAETNFVDVVPQKNRLRLSLNLRFHELHDPKGLAKDVTNLGRWGNGDVEVGLGKLDDLPYVMGLVRQAFEKQMGNEEGEA